MARAELSIAIDGSVVAITGHIIGIAFKVVRSDQTLSARIYRRDDLTRFAVQCDVVDQEFRSDAPGRDTQPEQRVASNSVR